jgi:hypothetical protein
MTIQAPSGAFSFLGYDSLPTFSTKKRQNWNVADEENLRIGDSLVDKTSEFIAFSAPATVDDVEDVAPTWGGREIGAALWGSALL